METLARWLILVLPLSVLSGFSITPQTPLIKEKNSPAVYYLTSENSRLVFPNEDVFYSWYPRGSGVAIKNISSADIAKYPLGGVVYYAPGVKMVKVATDPRVYAVSRAGVLRWVENEELARQLYGQGWSANISDLPAEFFSAYAVDNPISKTTDFDPARERLSTASIEQNRFRLRWLSVDQKRRAEQLTSIFENGTPVFNYAYVENLGDGRGYTSGRVGFTTATGDALLVIEEYADRQPKNVLARYLPRLRELAEMESDSVSGLEAYPANWALASKDLVFRDTQDEVMDDLYYRPAMKIADQLGLKTALSRAIIYDTIIQHGNWEEGPDSLPAIVRRTRVKMRGAPVDGKNETDWIETFLAVRKQDLLNPSDPETRDVWAESAGRCDVLLKLVEQKNFDLHGPIVIHSGDYEGEIL